MKLVVTGGAGFIGSNFVRHVVSAHPAWSVVVIDKLTYAGNLKNLADVLENGRAEFVKLDISDPEVREILRGCDAVVHFAAESHVDRSIENPAPFVRTNVEGTQRLLEESRRAGIGRFLHVSTDEVYGSLKTSDGKFVETSRLAPNSPYAATKASADLIVLSYFKTFGFPAIISRCSNNYGPYQFPEKFIPLIVCQAFANEPVPIYGDGLNVRDWIHVLDHCTALELILCSGRDGEIYNVGGDCEMTNLEVARQVLDLLGKPHDLIRFVADRPGHDRRYAIDCSKLKDSLGWRRSLHFEQGLRDTVEWYGQNSHWLREIRSNEYREYFAKHYLQRARFLDGLKGSARCADSMSKPTC
ncbi:MAG: dTDP-glucose 4,6-dehydratase [Verrucomicrobiales bacterium]|nr:dTDP-glucose 4,6-dehydratase [Verrucomicrobiales bacterium]